MISFIFNLLISVNKFFHNNIINKIKIIIFAILYLLKLL